MSSQLDPPLPTGGPAATDDATLQGPFHPAVAEHLGAYVYLLLDPRDDVVFAAGAGTADAAFEHLATARTASGDATGGHVGLARIRDIEAAGRRVRIDVLRHGLDAQTAETVRAAVADVLDLPTPGLVRFAGGVGRMSVGDVNTRYGADPAEIPADLPVLLVHLGRSYRNGTDDARLYEMARGWWPTAARRDAARWAFAVHAGVVRAVYRIDGWEPARAGNCWGFRGHRDPAMEQRYGQRDISAYVPDPDRGPVTHVNC